MSTISLSQNHNKDVEEVRAMVRELALKLDERYQLKSHWQDQDVLELHRQGIKGRLQIDPREVRVDIKLGLMMAAFKPLIRDELERALREKLA